MVNDFVLPTMTSNIERYFNNNSLRLLGLANTDLSALIDAASSAETPEALFSTLNASGLPDIPEAHEFVDNVFAYTKMAHDVHAKYVFDETQVANVIMGNNIPRQAALSVSEGASITPQSLAETRHSLPIFSYREHILSAVEEHRIIVLVAETGSGKSTQIAQYLHEAGYTSGGKKVVCSLPCRAAVTPIAARVAAEMGSTVVGQAVGYTVPFEDRTSERTVIKYVTDTILLREMLTHPDLDEYSALVIDDAHERTLSTDILLALVKGIASRRPELRVFISSATLDVEKFSEFFDNAPVFYVPGRRYPVEIYYAPQPVENYVHAAVITALQTLVTHSRGDILVFLPNKDSIEEAREHLQGAVLTLGNKIPELVIYLLYDELPDDISIQIFEPTPEGYRKVIFATDVATIAMTIPGVAFVIDGGFVQQNVNNPRIGAPSLVVVPCSRSSANMRAGRAGCAEPGKTFRLYTEEGYASAMEENSVPEIQRTDLSMIVLILKALGIRDFTNFELLDRPSNEALMQALELLYALEALDDRGELTRLGRQMVEFPLDPMSSKAILRSGEYMCIDEVLTIMSMLYESSSLFNRSKYLSDRARENFSRSGGDMFMLLNIWEQWTASDHSEQFCREHFLQYRTLRAVQDLRNHLASICERVGITVRSNPHPADISPIQKAITAGYFTHAAKLLENKDSYVTLKSNLITSIHSSSSLAEHHPKAKTVVYFDLVATYKTYMRQVMEIEFQWLSEMAPHYFR